uniref:Protein-serine/threonine phosphatase n=1 Tax=Entomoneis paludosa TaxID=265537 RepID=A0A7S3DMM3_9STRA
MHKSDRQSYESLTDAGIGGIVNCTKVIECLYRKEGIKYCQVAINDVVAADLLTYLPGATAFVHTCLNHFGVSVLVHCMAGVSRSTSIVLAYLVEYEGMTLEEAFVHVKKRRPHVQPNNGFWAQLLSYEKQCQQARQQKNANSDDEEVVVSSLVLSQQQQSNDVSTIDKEWAQKSSALYGACRDMELPEEAFIDGCFGQLAQLQHPVTDIERNAILNVALDYIWGRGVLEVEVDWLALVCRALDQQGDTTLVERPDEDDNNAVAASGLFGNRSCDVVAALLKDPDSEFCFTWTGEIYEHQVIRVFTALGVTNLEG